MHTAGAGAHPGVHGHLYEVTAGGGALLDSPGPQSPSTYRVVGGEKLLEPQELGGLSQTSPGQACSPGAGIWVPSLSTLAFKAKQTFASGHVSSC